MGFEKERKEVLDETGFKNKKNYGKEMKLLSFLGTKFIPRFSRPQKLSSPGCGPFLSVQRRCIARVSLTELHLKSF